MKSKSFHLKWSSHFSNMEKVFAGLVNSETLTDVSLVCADGQVIKSHRLLLSSSSDFLHNLFLNSSESCPVLFLPETTPEVLSSLLHFIYTGEIQVENEGLLSRMLELSDMLLVKGLDVAVEDRQKRNAALLLSASETMGNKRKTRSPRQYISPATEEEPRDLRSRKDLEGGEEVLKDRQEHNIMGEESSYNCEGPPSSKLMCLDEASGQAWASSHQIFSSMLPKMEPDGLHLSPLPRVKQEDGSLPPFPLHPPVNLTSEHISNILNTATVPICPLCGKDCANFPNLRTHLQTHNNSKPFACDFCDSKFTRASHLSRHRRSHTGEKPFECSICGKLFSRQDKLKVHVDRHRLKEQKEMKMSAARATVHNKELSQQQHQQHHLHSQQAPNWSVNAAFPSQVSPYPSYYDAMPKNQQHSAATLMPTFIG